MALPQKRFYRARAHSNPLNDAHFPVPVSPEAVDWSQHFPLHFPSKDPGNATDVESGETSSPGLWVKPGTDGSGEVAIGVKRAREEEPLTGAGARATEEGGGEGQGHGELPEVKNKAVGKADANAAGPSKTSERCEQGEPAVKRKRNRGGGSEGAKMVQFADVGCGFGGLLVKLSPMFPETLMVGMELRDKVSAYVHERILALRSKNPGRYQNISVIRTNAMKFLPNYFRKGQLTKIFFLFPDPHFKEKNHRRRIITTHLLSEYAFALAEGGTLYAITDVEELGTWMESHLAAHPFFQKLSAEELESDPVIPLLPHCSEEAQKVQRNKGNTYMSVYRRVPEQAE